MRIPVAKLLTGGVLCLGLAGSLPPLYAAPDDITVLNPRGNPPAIELIPMAPRLDTLDGKTVYFVDDGFLGGDVLLNEMMDWMAKHYPRVKTQFRKKTGGFAADDPKLWAEIKAQGDAMVMATGH